MLAFNERPAMEDDRSKLLQHIPILFYFSRLPGKAFAQQRYVWLSRANEADSKVFSRAILAKVSVFIRKKIDLIT